MVIIKRGGDQEREASTRSLKRKNRNQRSTKPRENNLRTMKQSPDDAEENWLKLEWVDERNARLWAKVKERREGNEREDDK